MSETTAYTPLHCDIDGCFWSLHGILDGQDWTESARARELEQHKAAEHAPEKPLRDAIADALAAEDRTFGERHDFTDDWEHDPETAAFVGAVMGVVRPEMRRLRKQVAELTAERDRARTAAVALEQETARLAEQVERETRDRIVADLEAAIERTLPHTWAGPAMEARILGYRAAQRIVQGDAEAGDR